MTVLMSEMTRDEYIGRIKNGVVILPVGATEQHGYHLPLGVDMYEAFEGAKLIAEKVNGVVAPPLAYGYKSLQKSGGGQSYPGTTSLSGETLILVIKDLLLEFVRHGVKNIVVYNHHYENEMFIHEGIDLAMSQIDNKDVRIMRIMPGPEVVSKKSMGKAVELGMTSLDLEHAGLLETSFMLYLKPDLVKMDRAVEIENHTFPYYSMYPEDPNLIHKSGVLSNPTRATKELGEQWINETVDSIAKTIADEFGLKVHLRGGL